MVGCGGGSSSADQIRPTKAMYDQITVGMTYAQVVSIVGGNGTRGNGFAGEADTATWSITAPVARLVVGLKDEKVTNKYYEGTETGGKGIAFPG